MRAVLQRVSKASVEINNQVHASIKSGFLILLGIEAADNEEDVSWLIGKIIGMRIFSDADDKMNLNISSIDSAAFLVISQFTLHASTKKGNRPSFIRAARPEHAIPLYETFIDELKNRSGLEVGTGVFGADMKVALINNGPVTIILDSKDKQ